MKKFKIVDKTSLIPNAVVIVIKKFRHSMSGEIMRAIRIDRVGSFGGSFSNYEIINSEEYEEYLKLKVKEFPSENTNEK